MLVGSCLSVLSSSDHPESRSRSDSVSVIVLLSVMTGSRCTWILVLAVPPVELAVSPAAWPPVALFVFELVLVVLVVCATGLLIDAPLGLYARLRLTVSRSA